MKYTHMPQETGLNRLPLSVLSYAWLAFCCIASGTLATIISNHRPLWLDELYMLITVRRPFTDGLLQTEDYSAPLYQLISRLWVHTDIPGTFLFRLPALLSAVLGLLSIWWMAKTLFNGRVAALSIFIVGFNPCFLNHATEARPYSMFLLFSVLSFGTFYKCLLCRSLNFLVAYVCSSVLLIYSHYFGLLAFPAQALVLLAYVVHTRQIAVFKRMCFAFGVVLFLSIPAFHLISRYTSEGLTALTGLRKTSLAALVFMQSGTTFFADSSLCILCIWSLLVMSWGVFEIFKLKSSSEVEVQNRNLQHQDSWYLPSLLTFTWIGFGWYLLLIASCFKPGYSDRYAFPVLVPIAIILSAITLGTARKVQVLILMIIIFSYAFQIRDQMKYATRDYPVLAAHLRSINNSGSRVWIADWTVLNDIEPVQYALRYYGYAGTNISRLALTQRPDASGFDIQQPDALLDNDHFFLITRKTAYEECADKYLEHSGLQYSKAKFGYLTLFQVDKILSHR